MIPTRVLPTRKEVECFPLKVFLPVYIPRGGDFIKIIVYEDNETETPQRQKRD
jgi:hypothetical protein